ncbi:MAG: RNA-binding cell elongation regulator Jag/EloR [Clostridia bacterium]
MDSSVKCAKDVDSAVKLALEDLQLGIDEVDVTVLEEPSRGFFGIGQKLALVKVEKKKEAKEPPKETKKPEVKKEKKPEKPQAALEEKPKAAKAETPKRKKERAPRRAEREMQDLEPVIEKIPEDELIDVQDHAALKFLEEVTKEMGLDLDIKAKAGKETLYIDIQGKDSGTVIGKRGQTLDAIQYLTSLVVNKEQSGYTRVVIDAENYRAKREKTLELLAIRLAKKVGKTKRSIKLEPMNPYERKVIHATLQNHPYVTTRSEGQDPYRRVIIELKHK